MLVLISGREKWENTGGLSAAETGADWQKQQARSIRRRGAGDEKRETTGGLPAAEAGADCQEQQARLIRRHGASAAMRSGKKRRQ